MDAVFQYVAVERVSFFSPFSQMSLASGMPTKIVNNPTKNTLMYKKTVLSTKILKAQIRAKMKLAIPITFARSYFFIRLA